jgi:hypothetical protein
MTLKGRQEFRAVRQIPPNSTGNANTARTCTEHLFPIGASAASINCLVSASGGCLPPEGCCYIQLSEHDAGMFPCRRLGSSQEQS